jgi:hypothetical protein
MVDLKFIRKIRGKCWAEGLFVACIIRKFVWFWFFLGTDTFELWLKSFRVPFYRTWILVELYKCRLIQKIVFLLKKSHSVFTALFFKWYVRHHVFDSQDSHTHDRKKHWKILGESRISRNCLYSTSEIVLRSHMNWLAMIKQGTVTPHHLFSKLSLFEHPLGKLVSSSQGKVFRIHNAGSSSSDLLMTRLSSPCHTLTFFTTPHWILKVDNHNTAQKTWYEVFVHLWNAHYVQWHNVRWHQ